MNISPAFCFRLSPFRHSAGPGTPFCPNTALEPARLHGRTCEAIHMYHWQKLCSGLHDLFHEHRHHEVLLCAKWRRADFRLSAVQTHYSYLKSQNGSTPSFCSRISIQSINLQTITHFELGQSWCMPVSLRCCCKASYTCTGNGNDLC